MDKFAELIDDIALAQGFEGHINARRAISQDIEELKQERDNLNPAHRARIAGKEGK